MYHLMRAGEQKDEVELGPAWDRSRRDMEKR